MLNSGTNITQDKLKDFFLSLYRKINALTCVELNGLTSGQLQRDGQVLDYSENYRSDLMNVYSQQYFDAIIVKGENYLKYYSKVLDDRGL